jgi:YcxB-like protein
MEYHGQLTADDLLRGYTLHRRSIRKWPRLVALWIGTFLATIVVLRLWPHSIGAVYGVGGTLLVVGALAARVWLPRRLRRIHQENRAMQMPFRTRLDANGFETASDGDMSRRAWSELRLWREDADYILLYESTDCFRIIPKRFLQAPGQLEDARRLLTEQLGPAA